MIRRTFLALFGGLFGGLFGFSKKGQAEPCMPTIESRKKVNGQWEAEGFYCSFVCMKCGCITGAGNVMNCIGCRSNHWAVQSVFCGVHISIKPPLPNCTMGKGMIILVPCKDGLFEKYTCGPDHRPVKSPDRVDLR